MSKAFTKGFRLINRGWKPVEHSKKLNMKEYKKKTEMSSFGIKTMNTEFEVV